MQLVPVGRWCNYRFALYASSNTPVIIMPQQHYATVDDALAVVKEEPMLINRWLSDYYQASPICIFTMQRTQYWDSPTTRITTWLNY